MKDITHEAALIRSSLSEIMTEISDLERKQTPTVASLSSLDDIKTRMERCSFVLSEADRWDRTNERVEAIFELHDIGKLAEEISSMRISLTALRDLPEYENRVKRLKELCIRLEETTNPRLRQALDSHDMEELTLCVGVFAQLKRTEKVKELYLQARQSTIASLFTRTNALLPSGSKTPLRLPEHLTSLLEDIMNLLNQESEWALQVRLFVLCNILTRSLHLLVSLCV